jgi:hypothetical protein
MLDFVIARKVFSLPNLHAWLTELIPPIDGRAGFFIEGVFLDKSPLDFIHHQGGTNTFLLSQLGDAIPSPLVYLIVHLPMFLVSFRRPP